MKFRFTTLPYQTQAVSSITDLFQGECSIAQKYIHRSDHLIGNIVSNILPIDAHQIQNNLHRIQRENKLPLTDDAKELQFCISMETGTGKTYVYIKTIYELYKLYGFTKFIIVVPSIAIREGVQKTFEVTQEHFAQLYHNIPIRCFMYDSKKLSDIRDFAQSNSIEVMIINIDAFNKDKNIIHQAMDRMTGERPIDLIAETNPIIIIDEPQSSVNTSKAQEALSWLNPLVVLRYSATHRDEINTVYRLSPIDAYEQGLVKQIYVSSIISHDNFNQPYIRLISVDNTKGYKATIELDVQTKHGITRTKKTITCTSDLFIVSSEREVYRDWYITNIDCQPGNEHIELNGAYTLYVGQAIGDISEHHMKRGQIRKTIEYHLDKELLLLPQGIKVLSLFFIDKVSKYRVHEGNTYTKGEYALIFEEEYMNLIQLPKYETIRSFLPFAVNAEQAHDGYFSKDKKGICKDTRGNTLDDQNTYALIMKDKERLLSMQTPLRFIFSHSALREGWDNPNVFQICTLLDNQSTISARQRIGRGLRLCMNQQGERIYDKDINILHVIATESFADFANSLQKEIEKETGMQFGIINEYTFADIDIPVSVAIQLNVDIPNVIQEQYTEYKNKIQLEQKQEELNSIQSTQGSDVTSSIIDIDEGESSLPSYIAKQYQEPTVKLGISVSEYIVTSLKEQNIIDIQGKITKEGKEKLQNESVQLPPAYQPIAHDIMRAVRETTKHIPVHNAIHQRCAQRVNGVLSTPQFVRLWQHINKKTRYTITMDDTKFIEQSVARIQKMIPIAKARIEESTAYVDIHTSGIATQEIHQRTQYIEHITETIPDILTILRNELKITKHTLRQILIQSGRLQDFCNNPEKFIEEVYHILKDVQATLAAEGIEYSIVENDTYIADTIFCKEWKSIDIHNAVKSSRSIYDYTIVDSNIEKAFVTDLEHDDDVSFYVKIPEQFAIPTPYVFYTPDWAILLNEYGAEKLYLVVETKGSTHEHMLRNIEQVKVRCAKMHFQALHDVTYTITTAWKKAKPTAKRIPC